MFNGKLGKLDDINTAWASKHGHYSMEIFKRVSKWKCCLGTGGWHILSTGLQVVLEHQKLQHQQLP